MYVQMFILIKYKIIYLIPILNVNTFELLNTMLSNYGCFVINTNHIIDSAVFYGNPPRI